MFTTWAPSVEVQFKRKLQRDSERSYRSIFSVAIPFFAAFSIADWMVSPPEVRRQTFIVRVLAVLFLIPGYVRSRKSNPPAWVPASLIFFASTSMIVMALLSNGYKSPYFFGISLIGLAVSHIFPWGPKKIALWIIPVTFSYLLAVSIKAGFKVDEPLVFINVVSFLLSCAVISIWGAWISDCLRRENFDQKLDTENEKVANARISYDLNTRDEFISIASHELKTPITAMKLQNWMLNRYLREADLGVHQAQIKTFIERNDHQVKKLARLVEDMLDISRITTGTLRYEMEAVNLSSLIHEIVERYHPQFSTAGIEVSVEIEPDITCKSDRLRMEQVITNLFGNAVKYAPKAPVGVRVVKKGGKAVVEVTDGGPGIDAELREKIFDRFERGQADSAVGGLGLGLYICKQIVTAHQGTIICEEAPVRGCSFRITVPLLEAHPN